jgi:hypothetical protein
MRCHRLAIAAVVSAAISRGVTPLFVTSSYVLVCRLLAHTITGITAKNLQLIFASPICRDKIKFSFVNGNLVAPRSRLPISVVQLGAAQARTSHQRAMSRLRLKSENRHE